MSEPEIGFMEAAVQAFPEDRINNLSEEDLQNLKEKYREQLDEYENPIKAITVARRNLTVEKNAGADYERVYTIGLNGPRPFGDNDAIFLYGVLNPEDEPLGKVVIIVEEDDVESFDTAIDLFGEVGNPVDAYISYRSADVVPDSYVANIDIQPDGDHEVFESPDPDDVDLSDERRHEVIINETEEAEIFNIGESLSLRDDDYLADFGLDIRRIEMASVASRNITDSAARYVMQDNSFVEPDQLTANAVADEDAGVETWAESHNPVEPDPMARAFVAVDRNDEGRITFRLYGFDEYHEQGFYDLSEIPEDEISSSSDDDDGSNDDSGYSGTDGQPVEERTI